MTQLSPRQARRTGRRLTSMVAVGALGAALTLSACSSSSKSAGSTISAGASPEQAVDIAVSNLGRQSAATYTFSLPITAAQAQQIAAKSSSSGSTSSKMSAAAVKALTTGSIFISVKTGHGEALDDPSVMHDPNTSLDFGLNVGGATPVEFRYVGQNAYLHLQLQQLLSAVGASTSSLARIQAEGGQINNFLPGVSKLLQGDWVELSHASMHALEQTLKQAESSSGQTMPNQSQLEASIMKLRTEVVSAIQANSTFASLGHSEYSVTTNVHTFLNTVLPEIQTTLAAVPGFGSLAGADLTKLGTHIPAGQTVVLDLFLSGSSLSSVELDINQFAPASDKMPFRVPVRMAVSTPGSISAPSGATQIDLSKLPAMLGGLLGGSSSGGSSSAVPGTSAG